MTHPLPSTQDRETRYTQNLEAFLRLRDSAGMSPDAQRLTTQARIALERSREALGLPKHRVRDGEFILAVNPDEVIDAASADAEVPMGRALERTFHEACEAYYARIEFAQRLCGDTYQTQRTPAQQAAMAALRLAEDWVGAVQDAHKNGNFGAYLSHLRREAVAGASHGEHLPESNDAVSPATFAQTAAVVSLTSQLAERDFRMQLAAASAQTAPLDAQTRAELRDAEATARLTDQAMQSMLAARAEHRSAVLAAVSGDMETAKDASTAAESHLNGVASKLSAVGERLRGSRAFSVCLKSLNKADAAVSMAQQSCTRSAAHFADGLAGFSARVGSLARAVRHAPVVMQKMTHGTGLRVERAALAVHAALSSQLHAVGSVAHARSRRAGEAAAAAAEGAWSLLEGGRRLVAKAGLGVRHSLDEAGLHALAGLEMAGGLMQRIGSMARQEYGQKLENLREQRKAERPTPSPR